MSSSLPPHLELSACRVDFGHQLGRVDRDHSPPRLSVALPALAGGGSEVLLSAAETASEEHGFCVFRDGSLVGGFAAAAPHLDLGAAALDLYRRLFAVTAPLHLYRVWNYVPHINAVAAGLENYRHFCHGRSLAFEEHFGVDFQRWLPAASAVGAAAGPLTIAFLAGAGRPRYLENPRQTPAFQYPPAYGPRAPSFSRATVVPGETGSMVFVAGTAAIRGHDTVAPGDLDTQITCTLENLQCIGQACEAGLALGGDGTWQRSFKVYLRHREDLPRAIARLESGLLRPGDQVAYLQADICRTELVFEIEARLTPSRSAV